jgi:hypothetical protein
MDGATIQHKVNEESLRNLRCENVPYLDKTV